MIEMKKIKLFVFTLCAMLVTIISVKAITPGTIQYTGSNVTSTNADGVYTLTLTGNADEDLIISSGETVILDLASYDFTNYTNGCPAIWIKAGGTLTIKGSGTIKLMSSSNENGPSAIDNAGTLIIDGGTISAEKKGTAAIYNSGTVTINGGTVKSNASGAWGLTNAGTATISGGTFENINATDKTNVVENNGTLTINGGTFKSNNPGAAAIHNSVGKTITFNNGTVETDVAGAWGLNNEGITTINNGTFTQNHDWSVILNSGTMTVANGTFNTSTGSHHNSLITTINSGTTNIDGGQFTVQEGDPIFFSGSSAGDTNVDGGTFIGGSLDTSLLEDGYAVDGNGNVYKLADYSSLEGAVSVAKGIDKSKYTAESVKALLEAIEDAEAVEKRLSVSDQSKIDELTKALTTAIANLKESGSEPVKPGSDNTDNSNEKAPNTFDAGLVYMGLALSAIGVSVVSVRKLKNN